MPTASVSIPGRTIPAGSGTLGPWPIADKWQRVDLVLDALALGSGFLSLLFEFSEDGITWEPVGGGTMKGGLGRQDKIGTLSGDRRVSLVLPSPNGKAGQIRMQWACTQSYVSTGGLITVTT